MKRVLYGAGAFLGALLLAAVFFFLWASSSPIAESNLAQIKQYAAAADSTAPDTVTVLTYNVGYLSGMTNNQAVVRSESLFVANMNQAVDLFRTADPDIAGLQEVDFGAARSFHVHQLDTLAARRNYPAAAQAVNWTVRYLPYPYGRPAVNFGRTISGQALLSRFPLRDHKRETLARPPQIFVRDAFYLDRLAQVVLLDLGGRALGIINVHLEAYDSDTRERQARSVNSMYKRLASRGLLVLLIGDVNSELPSHSRPSQAGGNAPTDSTVQILLRETVLQPVHSRNGREARGTYPADDPAATIDHIFYPEPQMQSTNVRVWCKTPNPPSDHCAVSASFVVPDSTLTAAPKTDALPPLDSLLAR